MRHRVSRELPSNEGSKLKHLHSAFILCKAILVFLNTLENTRESTLTQLPFISSETEATRHL